jgi:hypothetical protein
MAFKIRKNSAAWPRTEQRRIFTQRLRHTIAAVRCGIHTLLGRVPADARYAEMAPLGCLPTKHAHPGKRRIDGPQLGGLIANASQIPAIA